MDSRQLRYFAAVYEAQSVSRAAETINIAASALSHHLTNLEAELATSLFVRKPRGMQPTAAGERLYEHARGILRAINAAQEDIRDESREVSGEVSVGMSYSAVKAIGVDLMKAVLTDYPKLKLSISESLSGSTLVHLMSSEVDLAVVYNPPNDPKLRNQPILEEEMLCIGKPEIIGDTSRSAGTVSVEARISTTVCHDDRRSSPGRWPSGGITRFSASSKSACATSPFSHAAGTAEQTIS